MASAITMEGIEQAISNLEYKNQTTLKYRYVHHIRQYYTSDNSDRFPNEIDHEALIKILWDTDHSIEAIKNKRRNLNSVRSSVNADLKKLYEKDVAGKILSVQLNVFWKRTMEYYNIVNWRGTWDGDKGIS